MTINGRCYREFKSELAEAVLLGEDHFTRECRTALSELLVGMLQDGAEMTLYTIGNQLSEFAPQTVVESTGAWKERDLTRWTDQVRPQIFKALTDYFVEGGHERRIQLQRNLLDSLAVYGIQIEGRDVLDAVLPWSGDWPKRFVAFALMGRPSGVRFLAGTNLPKCTEIQSAMSEAGFDSGQIQDFLATLYGKRKTQND